MVVPSDALISAASGDFLLTLIAFFVVGCFGLFTYLVYWVTHDVLKKWDESTDRIITKMCGVIQKQCDIEMQLKDHDKQAEQIGDDVSEIKTTLANRPCIMKH